MKRTIILLVFLSAGLFIFIMAGIWLTRPEAEAAPPAIRPTPTPAPLPEGWQPPVVPEGFQDLYPDLIVEQITTSVPYPIVGVTTTIIVTIKNDSTRNVQNNFWVDLYINPPAPPTPYQPGDYTRGVQWWMVPGGGSWDLRFQVVFTQAGGCNLWAQVDTDNHVLEGNEGNNLGGPLYVFAKTYDVFADDSHEDFQMGMASNMDLSHSKGVMAGGIFIEPYTEPEIYRPDTMLNSLTGTFTSTLSYSNTSWLQVNPSIDVDPTGQNVFVAWQDGRYGSVYHNEIYFNWSNNGGASFQGERCVYCDAGGVYGQGFDQRNPALAYDRWNPNRYVYVVWQDNRNGNYDIYFSRATAAGNYADWIAPVRVNDNVEPGGGHADQIQPSIAVGPGERDGGCDIHVVWVDRRNGNDDVYYSRSTNCGNTWSITNTFVTDDPFSTKQTQRHPTVAVGRYGRIHPWGDGKIYVAWEDWRDPDNPEIYLTYSLDGGKTFDIDVPVTILGPGDTRDTYRLDPAMKVEWLTTVITDPGDDPPTTTVTYYVDIDVPIVAFQQVATDTQVITSNPDIYLAWTWHSYRPDLIPNPECPCCFDFCFSEPILLSGDERECLNYLVPPGRQSRPIEPSWQGEVNLAIAPISDFFSCKGPDYSGGAYVVWSDARNFDEWNYDLYVARVGHLAQVDPETGEVTLDHTALANPCADYILNDNAKIYYLRDNGARYMNYMPASASQRHPSIAVDETPECIWYPCTNPPGWFCQPTIYLAWDDDRWDMPLIPGIYRNRDVFFARTLFLADPWPYPCPPIPPENRLWVYISRVFDTQVPTPTWGILDWWGATDSQTPIYFQTRTGSNRNPPQNGLAGGGWSAWSGTYCGYYDAPGQPIVSPSNRYIQYKAIIAGPCLCTSISEVRIYYDNGISENKVYLPLILKNYR
ncbi:MAG: CARDB domain-containing protein [Anaerolineae bacterium]